MAVRVAPDVTALWAALDARRRAAGDPVEPGIPFWAAAWPGGQALARYLLDHPDLVAAQDVLDLGSGNGLVGVAALRAGARSVLASDIDPDAAAAVALTAEANGVTGIRCCGDLLDRPPPAVAVVTAGDVWYDRTLAQRLRPFLRAAAERGSTVLVGDPGRTYVPGEDRVALAAYDVVDPDDHRPRRTTVWRLHPPP